MNEAADVSTDSGQSASDAFDYSSTSIMGESDENVFKQFGLDASKYGLDNNQDETPKEESQGSEEAPEAAQATEESAFLERINSLGAVHNEMPFKVESVDQIKELMQKGQDYTVKTQALSTERKDFESDRDATKAQLNEEINAFNTQAKEFGQQLQEMQQWTFTLNQLQESAPDIFEEIQRAYKQTSQQFSNPVLNQQMEAQNRRFEELEKKLASREDKLIVDSFEKDFSALAPLEQSLKELGINIDKNAVKSKWASTGLSPEEVIGAMYGKTMMQAQASKAKVQTTAQKVAAKPIGAAGSSRPGTKAPSIDPKLSGLGYAAALWDRHTKR
jgi:predicted RNase H-like nuclease (RuvC/YqgF family)